MTRCAVPALYGMQRGPEFLSQLTICSNSFSIYFCELQANFARKNTDVPCPREQSTIEQQCPYTNLCAVVAGR